MMKSLSYTLIILALLGSPRMSFAGEPAPKPTPVSFSSTPKLNSKSKNREIKDLQKYLIELGLLGSDVTPVAKYGSKTQNAVLAFKMQYNQNLPAGATKLKEDKNFTASDWAALAATLNQKNMETWEKGEKARLEDEERVAQEKAEEERRRQEAEAASKVTTSVDANDFNKSGLSMAFDDDYLVISGSLPAECADSLTLVESKTFASESASITNRESLDAASKKVGVGLVYNGTKAVPTLSDCVDKYKGTRKSVDLSIKSLTSGKAVMGGLLVGEEFKSVEKAAYSATYLKLLKSIVDGGNCKDCEISERLSHADLLRNINIDGIRALEKDNLEKSVTAAEATAANSKTLRDLERARSQLDRLAQAIDQSTLSAEEKEALLAKIGAQLDGLLNKNDAIAQQSLKDCEKEQNSRSFYHTRTCHAEGQHADFMAATYKSIAKLPGLDERSREDAANLSADYARGGASRVDFISKLNPIHEEVTDALRSSSNDLRALHREAARECRFIRNSESYSRCMSAQQDLNDASKRYQELQQRYLEAQMSSVPLDPSMVYGPQPFVNPLQPGAFTQNGQNGMFPQQNGMFPQQNGMFPQQNGMFPQQNGMFPQQNGMFPQQNGMFPQQNGMFPQQNGMFPQQNGMFPQQGFNPMMNGMYAQNGMFPQMAMFGPQPIMFPFRRW